MLLSYSELCISLSRRDFRILSCIMRIIWSRKVSEKQECFFWSIAGVQSSIFSLFSMLYSSYFSEFRLASNFNIVGCQVLFTSMTFIYFFFSCLHVVLESWISLQQTWNDAFFSTKFIDLFFPLPHFFWNSVVLLYSLFFLSLTVLVLEKL